MNDDVVRTLMRLGWQAAKATEWTGKRILDFGAYADEDHVSADMMALWGKALSYAGARLLQEAWKRGHVEESDSKWSDAEMAERMRAERDAANDRAERLRIRASEHLDAAGLDQLYRALEEDNMHTAAALVQRLANTLASALPGHDAPGDAAPLPEPQPASPQRNGSQNGA